MPTPAEWEKHWTEQDTPWNLKGVTPALIKWVQNVSVKGLKILVPGCGHGHDAYFLAKHGAKVTAVDFSPSALKAAQANYQHPKLTWLNADVRDLPYQDEFDRIWEYTCFCALEPSMRKDYFQSLRKVLKPGGNYWGLVFLKVPEPENGPPFQVGFAEFKELLEPYFKVDELEAATNRSVKPRRGSEIWFEVHRPS